MRIDHIYNQLRRDIIMSFWRSNTVNCYQLILPRENAHRVVEQLGRLGNIEFKLQLHPVDRPYIAQIKLIEEATQRLSILEGILNREETHAFPKQYSRVEFQAFLEIADRRYRLSNRSHSHLLETVVEEIQHFWTCYHKLQSRKEELGEESVKLREELAIIKAGETLFGSKLYRRAVMEEEFGVSSKIQFKCGVIMKRDEGILRRTIFRMTKGLSIYYSTDYKEGGAQQKAQVVFFLIFGYGDSKVLSNKVERLLDNYKICSYQYPDSQQQSKQLKERLSVKLQENGKLTEMVQTQMNQTIKPLVTPLQGQKSLRKFEYYRLYLLHEKKIYEKLNQMKLHHNFYEALIFIQSKNIERITNELHQRLADDQMPPPQFIPIESQERPTLFDLNSVTRTPYEILSAYGTPHYKEANPAMFNLVTFPFMFGVMFGDIAHGLALFSFGLLLIFSEFFINPVVDALRPHKYTITLMGFFAFYCGIIYNQYLSLSFNIFGSCYQISNGIATQKENCVYPIGVDPIWSITNNDLNFTNSLKMKIAVIIALVHMTLGIVVKGLNNWYYNKKMHILIQILPQLTFLLTVFGYMDFLIVYKWLHLEGPAAPSIITTMINIPLQLGKTTDCCGGQPMWGTFGDTSQDKIQLFLLAAALVSVPIMFGFPLLYEFFKRRSMQTNEKELNFDEELANSKVSERDQLVQAVDSKAITPMGELVVYQFIQTIQFVLGCISNTASYLRLWALSLAHNQLSDVFFEETVQVGLESGFLGILYNILLFPIFAGVTFGILICMDSMECFLHTLRLHWVEFQSKFYKGDGRQFKSSDFLTHINEQLSLKQ